tara:strand:- start:753 stop:1028 length:276 start_codon:yes stop_codon:yes gene_type:complete
MNKGLEKLDDYKHKDEMINKIMLYSYLLITNQMSFDDLTNLEHEEGFGLIFDPYDPNINEDEIIDTLLDHFIYLEEYEKCQDLIDLRNEKK